MIVILLFQGYLERQKFLLDEFYFSCQCHRCRDPAEFGTFTSSIVCPHCRAGFTLCSPGPEWACTSCSRTTARSKVIAQEKKARDWIRRHRLGKGDDDVEYFLDNLEHVQKLLHENHFLVMDLKQKFVLEFGSSPQQLDWDRDKIDRFLSTQETFCRQLLQYQAGNDRYHGTSNIGTRKTAVNAN